MNEIPRRIQVEKMTPAELAIRNAVLEVEKMGADVRLTNIVNILLNAQTLTADYVDSNPTQ